MRTDILQSTEPSAQDSAQGATKPQVRSVVSVRFNDGREYPYYNDTFDLQVDDIVYVDGKLAGKPGRVTEVITRFKVSLDYYKRVLGKLDLHFHGSFQRQGDFMVADGNPLPFAQVQPWFYPPREEEEEFFIGDGYQADLRHLKDCPDLNLWDYQMGQCLLEEGKVLYLSVQDGQGCALVASQDCHTVNFTLHGDTVADLYCDCISPHFCKHLAALCLALQQLQPAGSNFVAMEHDLFFRVLSAQGGGHAGIEV